MINNLFWYPSHLYNTLLKSGLFPDFTMSAWVWIFFVDKPKHF